jgi:UMF1 family MFS transporter
MNPQPAQPNANPLADTTNSAPNNPKPHVITRRAVVGWVLYDLANTIFSMGVVSLFFSLWVREAVGVQKADATYGVIAGISMAIIFFVSPLLGAMTDRAPRRMPFLVVSTVVCVGFTALLARAGFYFTVCFFIIANVAYQAGLQFYDALLPEVSTESNRGRIGGLGVGVGYFGSYLAVGLSLILQRHYGSVDKSFYFSLVAGLFLVFALPCFCFVRERGNPNPRPINFEMVRNSTRETLRTLRSGQQYPGLVRFLIGRIFYTDAINTVINVMSLYTVNVAVSAGFSDAESEKRAQWIMMSAISFAVVGGFFWGWLTDRIGPKRTLNIVLRVWIGIFIFAACIGILSLPLGAMYVMSALAGFAFGGMMAADRPYMLRLTPPSRIGEFYGLYGMVGRFSAITGPIIWALTTWLLNQKLGSKPLVGQGISVLVLMVLVIISYIILQPVSDKPREWNKETHPKAAAA